MTSRTETNDPPCTAPRLLWCIDDDRELPTFDDAGRRVTRHDVSVLYDVVWDSPDKALASAGIEFASSDDDGGVWTVDRGEGPERVGGDQDEPPRAAVEDVLCGRSIEPLWVRRVRTVLVTVCADDGDLGVEVGDVRMDVAGWTSAFGETGAEPPHGRWWTLADDHRDDARRGDGLERRVEALLTDAAGTPPASTPPTDATGARQR